MKIPRVKSGPLCYTLEEWGMRTAISQFSLFGFLGGIFIWLSTKTLYEDSDAVFLVIGILCLIPSFFGFVLSVGICKRSSVYILIWCVFELVSSFLVLAVFEGAAIYLGDSNAVEDATGAIIVCVIFGIVFFGNMIYNCILMHSLSLNYKEEKAARQIEQACANR